MLLLVLLLLFFDPDPAHAVQTRRNHGQQGTARPVPAAQEILQIQVVNTARKGDKMSLLSIDGLTQRFGGLQAVSDFNIELEEGSLTGLIGPNGAGKTTIFNLISGFYQPTEGTITLAGKPTRGLKPHQVTAQGVARTFQNIRLWHDMTVMDNIRIAHINFER